MLEGYMVIDQRSCLLLDIIVENTNQIFSQGIMPLDGVIPAITEQDTTGHLARSPYLFSTVGKEWYAGLGGLQSYAKKPTSLLVGTDLTFCPYQEQLDLYEDFLVKLEGFMEVNRTNVNITSAWEETANISQSLNDWASPIYYDMNNVSLADHVYKSRTLIDDRSKIGGM